MCVCWWLLKSYGQMWIVVSSMSYGLSVNVGLGVRKIRMVSNVY